MQHSVTPLCRRLEQAETRGYKHIIAAQIYPLNTRRFTDMSAEVRIQVSSVVNPVPENFWHSPLRRALCCLGHQRTLLILSNDSDIHPVWKVSTCEQSAISPEERRRMKLIIAAPLTFNELVLHSQDKAFLKLPSKEVNLLSP